MLKYKQHNNISVVLNVSFDGINIIRIAEQPSPHSRSGLFPFPTKQLGPIKQSLFPSTSLCNICFPIGLNKFIYLDMSYKCNRIIIAPPIQFLSSLAVFSKFTLA